MSQTPEERAKSYFEEKAQAAVDKETRKQKLEEEAAQRKREAGRLDGVPEGVAWGLVIIVVVLAIVFFFLTR